MKIRMFTLPNMLTLGNLLCGCAALVFCLGRGDLGTVFWLVVAAAVFDFADGFAARLTGSYSELGKQLDSLADMVSAGVVPSAVLFTLYINSGGAELGIGYGVITASVALFSALRLARFNIDPQQSKEFRGMPTPACALLVTSAGYLLWRDYFTVHPVAILAVSIVLSYLLICPVRMFALKFDTWSWRNNRVRYSFIVLAAASLAIWGMFAVPLIITGYVIVSIATHFLCPESRCKAAGKGE